MEVAKSAKLVVCGDFFVGKTTLLVVYTTTKVPGDYIPSVFDNTVSHITVENQQLDLSLWDISGQEEYDRARALSYNSANVFILCFSISQPASFESITQKWYPELSHFCPDVPVILLGTKRDLRSTPEEIDKLGSIKQVPITVEMGEELAKKLKAYKYLECSSFDKKSVEAVFLEAGRAVLNPKKFGGIAGFLKKIPIKIDQKKDDKKNMATSPPLSPETAKQLSPHNLKLSEMNKDQFRTWIINISPDAEQILRKQDIKDGESLLVLIKHYGEDSLKPMGLKLVHIAKIMEKIEKDQGNK